jgi:ADP-ribose pyrophosphatase YjhB (NUDIX family)
MSDRDSYITQISHISAFDALEDADIKETTEWLKASVAIHKPQNMNQHLGVIFLVVSQDGKETFLLHHRKAGVWLPPGGHVKEGQGFQEAVLEEMKEEIGVELPFRDDKPYFFVKTLTRGANAGHIDATAWFIAQADNTEQFTFDAKEALDGSWFKMDEIVKNPEFAHIERPLKKAMELIDD